MRTLASLESEAESSDRLARWVGSARVEVRKFGSWTADVKELVSEGPPVVEGVRSWRRARMSRMMRRWCWDATSCIRAASGAMVEKSGRAWEGGGSKEPLEEPGMVDVGR